MLWTILAFAVLASSPLGRALVDRLRGRVGHAGEDLEEIGLMEQRMEDRIVEMEDRIEFTERLLSRPDDRTQVSGD